MHTSHIIYNVWYHVNTRSNKAFFNICTSCCCCCCCVVVLLCMSPRVYLWCVNIVCVACVVCVYFCECVCCMCVCVCVCVWKPRVWKWYENKNAPPLVMLSQTLRKCTTAGFAPLPTPAVGKTPPLAQLPTFSNSSKNITNLKIYTLLFCACMFPHGDDSVRKNVRAKTDVSGYLRG